MNKKLTNILVIISVFILLSSVIYIFNTKKNTNYSNSTENTSINKNKKIDINFLKAICGLKANNLEVINDPLGFRGELFVPKEALTNGINYFLEKTDNNKMKDINIDIENNTINIYVNYHVTKNINTPLEVEINPSLNQNKDLLITLGEVRFLDLKISNWIVNLVLKSFTRDWFPANGKFELSFDNNAIIMYKENFTGIYINSLYVKDEGLNIDAIIDLQKILNY